MVVDAESAEMRLVEIMACSGTVCTFAFSRAQLQALLRARRLPTCGSVSQLMRRLGTATGLPVADHSGSLAKTRERRACRALSEQRVTTGGLHAVVHLTAAGGTGAGTGAGRVGDGNSTGTYASSDGGTGVGGSGKGDGDGGAGGCGGGGASAGGSGDGNGDCVGGGGAAGNRAGDDVADNNSDATMMATLTATMLAALLEDAVLCRRR